MEQTNLDWIPESTKPPLAEKVFIVCKPLGICTGFYWGEDGMKQHGKTLCNGWSISGVTHWLPLTALPKPPEI